MRAHRPARPDRACLASGIVADGEHEIDAGGIRACEFIPALRAQALRFKAAFLAQSAFLWMPVAFREASCALRPNPSFSITFHQPFRQVYSPAVSPSKKH